jgi:eukaryotic-like serine/threonine-protein kinase
MALQAGSRLGPYEVIALIGAGGMGEVYQARDTRLDRKVAVKVLAPELASDVEFRARFEREAKAISSLNHPHICGLYDIGREHDTEYLVLELLEGETLASRIERGPLPLPQVLRFGIEIADALEAAHRHGIVHRDLKPANIMLTAAGTKLLDFGLAKHTVGAAGQALSMLATAPGTGTTQGTIIGTLQYMAPEQVQGAPADARTDIFALGTILYEMATGRRAFEARTQASLIAKILETDVPAVSTLAPLTPPALDHVVQACLAKEPADRWQTAHDVRLQLQWIQTKGSASDVSAAATLPRRRTIWLWCALAAVIGAALAASALLMLWWRPAASVAQAVRFGLLLPPEIRQAIVGTGAISPDGRRFVWRATVDGREQLMVRDMASTAILPIPGTEGGYRPFWSPDSRSVAFFVMGTRTQLKTVPITGGPPRVLAEAESLTFAVNGTWADGFILFGPRQGRIYRVAETGGTATALETLPWKPGQKAFVAPKFLPDGRHFLVKRADDPAVYVASVDVPGTRKLLDDASSVAYAAGHLFYSRGTTLFARSFDATRQAFSGPEMEVTARAEGFSVSNDDIIVYQPSGVARSSLTWFDRNGRRTGTLGPPGPFDHLALSPRGRRVVVVRADEYGNSWDLWDADVTSGIFSRLTTDPADDSDPAWSPDERALAFTSNRNDGSEAVFVKDLTTGTEEPLVSFQKPVVVDQWTPDGRFILFRSFGKAVYAMPLTGDRTPRMLVDTPFLEDEIHVSPDGRWVAFHTNESGRWEIYVAAFPTFTAKRQLSSGGGVQPQWRADSRELFYLAPDGSMMSVRVDPRAQLTVSPPSLLFPTTMRTDPYVPQYGVTPDGQRFLGLEPVGGDSSFIFLLNWREASSK